MLVLAAAWADCHGESDGPDQPATHESSVLVERFVRMGPVGTPLVAETCPSSLALAQQSSVVAARLVIGDALAIRHQLPQLWVRVQAGEVMAWKAREVARRTSELSVVSARVVDRIVTGQVELLAWGRFERLLEATLLQVDEKSYQQRAAKAAAQRDVRATPSGDGLRTLVARVDAGDATAFLALVERVAAHQGDPSDPWAADLPPAGWETARHGNVHQPCFDDLEDDCWTSQSGPTDDDEPWSEEPPVDDTDLAWHAQQRHPDAGVAMAEADGPSSTDAGCGTTSAPEVSASVPAAFRRPAVGSSFDLRPFTTAEASSCGPRVVIHVHLSDQTLIDQHGVVRTEHGPLTLDQFRQWLTQADPTITIRPVFDPAAAAAVDAYEIPQRLRQP